MRLPCGRATRTALGTGPQTPKRVGVSVLTMRGVGSRVIMWENIGWIWVTVTPP